MKINKILLIIIIIVVILLVATIINYQSLKIKNITNPIIESRITSLSYSIENVGENLEKVKMKKATDNTEFYYDFSHGKYLIMINSSKGCNICLWQELDLIKKYTPYLMNLLKIKYIFLGDNRIEALQFNKSLLTDTLYVSMEEKLYKLNRSLKYPYLVYVKDGKTFDYHFPIPGDTVFSNLFYLRLLNKSKF